MGKSGHGTLFSAVGAVAALGLTTLAGCTGGGSAASAHATITVNAPTSLADQALRITVSGLAPGDTITVTGTATDFHDQRWQSHATFLADSHGDLDLSKTAPLSGSYSGVDGVGLFWSMNPPPGSADPGFIPSYESALVDGALPAVPVRLTVTAHGTRLAQRTLTREWMGRGVRGAPVTLAADSVSGQLFLPPKGTARHPAVLIFGGSEGGDSQEFGAAVLASHGYPALSLAYFDTPGLPPTLQNIPLEYFARAARLLASEPGVDPAHIVACGYSRGSEAALLLGADYSSLIHGVIVYSPADMVHPGLPSGVAWRYQGKPVPVGSPIPVSLINGPVLAIAGADDELWPSAPSVQTIANELDAAHDRYAHRSLIYPGAGHLVGTYPYQPGATTGTDFNGDVLRLGGSRAADDAAQERGWPQVLSFLASLLRRRPVLVRRVVAGVDDELRAVPGRVARVVDAELVAVGLLHHLAV